MGLKRPYGLCKNRAGLEQRPPAYRQDVTTRVSADSPLRAGRMTCSTSFPRAFKNGKSRSIELPLRPRSS